MKAKNLTGVKCPKCFGASWRRRNGSRRILTCSCALVKMRTCEKKIDRVRHPQNTIEAVKMVTVEKKLRPV